MLATKLAKIQQIILALLLVVFTWQSNIDALQISTHFYMPVFLISAFALIALSFFSPTKSTLRFSWVDVSFSAWVIWHFVSFFWAEKPFLIWDTAFHWLSLFIGYIAFKRVDISSFSPRFWSYFLSVWLAIFLVSLALFFFELAALSAGWLFTSDDLLQTKALINVHGNYLSALLMLLIPAYFMLFQWRMVSPFLVAIMLLIHLFFLISLSAKASLIALCIAGLYYLFATPFFKPFRWKASIGMLLLFVFLGGSMLLNPQSPIQSYNPLRPLLMETKDERASLWNKSISLCQEKPILGWGDGHWKIEHLKYGVESYKRAYFSDRYFSHAHNIWFQTASELGIIGISLLLILLVCVWVYILRSSHKAMLGFYFLAWFCLSFFYGLAYPVSSKLSIPTVFLMFIFANVGKPKFSIGSTLNKTILVANLMLAGTWSIYQLNNHYLFQSIIDLEKNKAYSKAAEAYNQLQNSSFNLLLGPKPIALRKAKALWRSKQKDEAILSLNESLAIHPYDWNTWHLLGKYYLNRKEKTKAYEAFNTATIINPNHFDSHLQAAKLAYQKNNKQAARAHLAFYEKDILSKRASFFSDDKFYTQDPHILSYLETLCLLEDGVLAIREKYEVSNQID